MISNKNLPIVIWLFTGCVLVYLMVIIGGLTRLTHSGLSMVEWKPTGSLPPMNQADWNIQFDKYKESPEFKLVNSDFTLDDFKKIFWWEYIHRFIGRLIGVVFLLPFFYFLIRKKFHDGFLKKMLLLLLIGASQGLVGWFMVKSGLQKNPNVSHYRLATHLITALTAFGFTFWFMLDLIYPKTEGTVNKILKKFMFFTFIILISQIIYGAFVAGLKAGYIYPTFPKMGDSWIAPEVTANKPFWLNFIENPAGVQFIHRCIAISLVIISLVLFLYFRNKKTTPLQKKIIQYYFGLILIQFTLGILTLLTGVSVIIASLHQTGAFFLFATSLFLLHRLKSV